MLGHQMIGLLQIQKTGGTGRHELLLVRPTDRQVPGNHAGRHQFVLREILGGPAAIPVVQLFQLKPQDVRHRTHRYVVCGTPRLERTTWIVRVFHDAPPISLAFLMIARNWSICRILFGLKCMRPRVSIDKPHRHQLEHAQRLVEEVVPTRQAKFKAATVVLDKPGKRLAPTPERPCPWPCPPRSPTASGRT